MNEYSLSNKTILIISPEKWGVNKLSKHLYAEALAKNNKVFFLETTENIKQNELVKTECLSDSLTIVKIKRIAKGITKFPDFLIDLQNKRIIRRILKKINLNKFDIVWNFDQSKFRDMQLFAADYRIFHPVDYITSSNKYAKRIAETSDVIFSVSEEILNTFNVNTPKYFINHGLEKSFILDVPKPINYKIKNNLNVGYIGNLLIYSLDWKNLLKTIKENSNLNFIFIGPYYKSNLGGSKSNQFINKLKLFKNVKLLGEKSKDEIKELFNEIDIFWLCYDNQKYPVQTSNSHKILEYLSSGKVVVSNYIKQYEQSNLLEMVSNNEQLSLKIKEIAENITSYNTEDKMKARIEFANVHTYEKQIEKIEKILSLL